MKRTVEAATAPTHVGGRFLTRRQAAEMLGLKPTTLAVWQSQGSLNAPPMRKHGRRVMYAEQDLLAWSEERRVP